MDASFLSKLKQWEQRLRLLTEEVQEKELLKIAAEFEPVAVDMNTAQLLDGKDSKGQFLAPYRNDEYSQFKRFLNPKGVTDLKLTGRFHSSFFQDAKQFPIEIFATDQKTGKLVDAYGPDIFGLDPNNTKDFADQLKPDVIEFYQRAIQL